MPWLGTRYECFAIIDTMIRAGSGLSGSPMQMITEMF